MSAFQPIPEEQWSTIVRCPETKSSSNCLDRRINLMYMFYGGVAHSSEGRTRNLHTERPCTGRDWNPEPSSCADY